IGTASIAVPVVPGSGRRTVSTTIAVRARTARAGALATLVVPAAVVAVSAPIVVATGVRCAVPGRAARPAGAVATRAGTVRAIAARAVRRARTRAVAARAVRRARTLATAARAARPAPSPPG